MDSHRQRAVIFILAIAASAGLLWLGETRFSLIDKLPRLEDDLTRVVLDKVRQEITAPPPLVGPRKSGSSAILTENGVFEFTNLARATQALLSPLSKSEFLDRVAEARADDMFAKQYFEHTSPTGETASEVAKKVGYEFITIGENIALGNFDSDSDLVDAWMNSPGHRANILSNSYTEIGIAVKKGFFDGGEEWIGVQIFAKPLSACLVPRSELKAEIDSGQKILDILYAQANNLRTEIESMEPKTKSERSEYNQKVQTYNLLVDQINSLVAEMKARVATYNATVQKFNDCAKVGR